MEGFSDRTISTAPVAVKLARVNILACERHRSMRIRIGVTTMSAVSQAEPR
jgi:hypothetical protein